MMSLTVCSLVLQSVPVGRCLVTVQVLVHTSVRTCGHTLSVYLDPASLGVLALLDRSEHAWPHMRERIRFIFLFRSDTWLSHCVPHRCCMKAPVCPMPTVPVHHCPCRLLTKAGISVLRRSQILCCNLEQPFGISATHGNTQHISICLFTDFTQYFRSASSCE